MENFKEKNILVTGGYGFLGSFVMDKFRKEGCEKLHTFSSKKFDLTKEDEVKKLFEHFKNTEIVIHIAADIGGIGYSSKHPAQQYYNNILMNTYMLNYSRLNNIEKFVGIGTVCEYPADTPVPFSEENLWNGYPVLTNDAYGLSKRMMLAQSYAYRREFGLNAIHLLLANLYGPRDNFSLDSSHVIPALIRKVIYAIKREQQTVEVWGTGEVSREFLYVEDAADAIFEATKLYSKSEPINIGTGEEITIKDLVHIIAKIMQYKGQMQFNENKPTGQLRRKLDINKASREFGFQAKTSLELGLRNTIEWYMDKFPK